MPRSPHTSLSSQSDVNSDLPPAARTAISILVGPASFLQSYGGICASYEGKHALEGHTSSYFMLPFSFPDHWIGSHAGAAAVGYLISLTGYGMGVMGAYILAQNRLALPAPKVVRLISVELARATLFIVAGAFLLAGVFPTGSYSALTLGWILAGVGAGSAAFFLYRHFKTRIREWKAGWETAAPDPLASLPR